MSASARKEDQFNYDLLPVPQQRIIDAIYERLGSVISKIDTLSNRAESLEHRATSIDSRLASLESRMSSLEASMTDIKSASHTAIDHLEKIINKIPPDTGSSSE